MRVWGCDRWGWEEVNEGVCVKSEKVRSERVGEE